MYLYHIVHVGRETMLLYGFAVVIITLVFMWAHCEFRRCTEQTKML